MKLTMRIGLALLVFLAVLATPSYSGLRGGALKVQRVEVGGTQPNNTTAIFDKFALVAPYSPSQSTDAEVMTPGVVESLDNNKLYIVNTQNPKDEPIQVSLGACHFPTAILCDGRNVFVRGTAFTESGESYEVIATVQLHLEDDGKPAAGRAVIVEIPAIDNEGPRTAEAPTDMVLGLEGKYLLFTNGVWVFSYNLDEGYVYRVGIFSAKDYGPGSYISFAGYDERTKTLVVSHNIEESVDGKSTHRTVLRFYSLETSGVLSSLKIVESSEFPEGAYLYPESEVAIAAGDDGTAEFAYFGMSNGVYQIDLHRELFGSDLFGHVKQIGQFADLARGEGDAGPRLTKFDPSGQRIWVVNPGSVPLGIRRPLFGQRGRNGIRRPLFIRSQESAAVVSAELNGKRTKLVQTSVLTDLVDSGDSISGFVLREDLPALLSTRSGRVLEVGFAEGTREANVELLGELGTVDYFTFAQDKIIALSSAFEQEDDRGELVMSPGSLVVATRKEGKTSSVALGIAQMLSPSAPPLAKMVPSIRRPCNLGR